MLKAMGYGCPERHNKYVKIVPFGTVIKVYAGMGGVQEGPKTDILIW